MSMIDEERRQARRSANERFLTILSGLRKVGNLTNDEIAYNNALADAFDYIIDTENKFLFDHTVWCGKWKRD